MSDTLPNLPDAQTDTYSDERLPRLPDLPRLLPIAADMPGAVNILSPEAAWVLPAMQALRPQLGLLHWYIWVVIDPAMGKDDDEEQSGGVMCMDIDLTYLQARLRIAPDVTPNLTGMRCLLHELLHLAMAPYSRAVEALSQQVRPASTKALGDLWIMRAEEEVVERLTRALGPIMADEWARV